MGAKSTSTTSPCDCCSATAVLTAAVVQPAPPLALRNVKTRALPSPPRLRVREELNRVSASSNGSDPAELSKYSPAPARIPRALLDQHVDGVLAIVHRNDEGNSERKAQVLAQRLRQVTEEFLVHENRDRPGYLDEADAPKLAP